MAKRAVITKAGRDWIDGKIPTDKYLLTVRNSTADNDRQSVKRELGSSSSKASSARA